MIWPCWESAGRDFGVNSGMLLPGAPSGFSQGLIVKRQLSDRLTRSIILGRQLSDRLARSIIRLSLGQGFFWPFPIRFRAPELSEPCPPSLQTSRLLRASTSTVSDMLRFVAGECHSLGSS